MQIYKLFTDGGSRGNPGNAGAGWILFNQDDILIDFGAEFLGTQTNNFAEYQALLIGLKRIIKKNKKILKNLKSSENQNNTNLQVTEKNKIDKIICHLYSELIVKQLTGVYKIKNKNLKPIAIEIKKLIKDFEEVKFIHIVREKNFFADNLVNLAIDAYEKN